VDRGIRESKAIDFKKLLLVPGEKARFVFVDIYVLNHDGNMFDACYFAALAALKTTKIPKLDKEYNVIKGEYDGKLELEKMPIMSTYSKISNKIILDPDLNEDYATEARLSITLEDSLNVCALQKGEKGSFSFEELKEIIKTSKKNYKETKKIFEKL
jgi:exosome complex component RRP42